MLDKYQYNYFDTNKLPNYCTEEILEKYYNVFLYNLKNYTGKSIWLHPLDIDLSWVKKDLNTEWTCIKDKFLENTVGKQEELGYDLLKNGTYWPVYLKRREDDSLKLLDGLHRVYSTALLAKKGIWPKDKKLLFLLKNEEEDNIKKEDKRAYFHAPLYVTNSFKKLYRPVYFQNNLVNYQSSEFGNEFLKTELDSFKSGAFQNVFSLLLRNALFEYRNKTGNMIKTGRALNNEEEWEEWYNDN